MQIILLVFAWLCSYMVLITRNVFFNCVTLWKWQMWSGQSKCFLKAWMKRGLFIWLWFDCLVCVAYSATCFFFFFFLNNLGILISSHFMRIPWKRGDHTLCPSKSFSLTSQQTNTDWLFLTILDLKCFGHAPRQFERARSSCLMNIPWRKKCIELTALFTVVRLNKYVSIKIEGKNKIKERWSCSDCTAKQLIGRLGHDRTRMDTKSACTTGCRLRASEASVPPHS